MSKGNKKRKNSNNVTPGSDNRTKEANISNSGGQNSHGKDYNGINNSQVNGSYLSLLNDSGGQPLISNGFLTMAHSSQPMSEQIYGTTQFPNMTIPGQGMSPVPPMHTSSPTPINMHSMNQTGVQLQQNPNFVNYNEMFNFMKTNFQEMNARLGKLESLENKVNDIGNKITKLYDKLDTKVNTNSQKIEHLDAVLKDVDFDVAKTMDDVTELRNENRRVKRDLVDVRAKSMMSNLIIGD